jgi:hypothetical protein
MSSIDKQRIAAVAMLRQLGYTFSIADGWTAALTSVGNFPSMAECDGMHAVLMRRADALAGSTEGSAEEAELKAIVGAIEAYEAKRWPEGMEPRSRRER